MHDDVTQHQDLDDPRRRRHALSTTDVDRHDAGRSTVNERVDVLHAATAHRQRALCGRAALDLVSVRRRRAVAPPRVRGRRVGQRVARRRQPQPGERSQVRRKDDRLPVDVAVELGPCVPDVSRILVVEADVDVRPLPRRPGRVTRTARRPPRTPSKSVKVVTH